MLMNNIERVGLGHNSKNITLESFLIIDPETNRSTGRIKLTNEIIDKYLIRKEIRDKNGDLKRFERTIACDSEVVGLRVIINKGGKISWFFEKYINGKQCRYQIGPYKDFSVVKARKIALELKSQIAVGKDYKTIRAETANAKTLSQVKDLWLENRILNSNISEKNKKCLQGRIRCWLMLNPSKSSFNVKTLKAQKFIADNYNQLNIKDKPLISLTKDDLLNWYRTVGKCSRSSANRVLDDLRSIFSYAEEIGEVSKNIAHFKTKELFIIDPRMSYIEPYKKEEWKRIIKSALKLSKNKEKGNFYSCMSIMLLASCGRRKDEVNTLNFDQIKDGNSTIVYRSANVKNKTPIRVPLTSFAQGVIKRLRKAKHKNSNLLFPSTNGGRFFSKSSKVKPLGTFYKTWRTIVAMAKVEYKPPHMLRHTFACLLLEKFKDIKLVALIMGWKSLRAAEIYLKYLDQTVVDSIKEFNSFLKLS